MDMDWKHVTPVLLALKVKLRNYLFRLTFDPLRLPYTGVQILISICMIVTSVS